MKQLINKILVDIKLLNEKAELPTYAHTELIGGEKVPMDGAMDIKATSLKYDRSMDCYIYGTGLSFNVRAGRKLHALPRSSNRKTDCYIPNHVPLLDPMYSNELFICYKNRTSIEMRLKMMYLEKKMEILESLAGLSGDAGAQCKPIAFQNLRETSEWYYDAIEKGDEELEFAPYEVGDKIAQIFIEDYTWVQWNVVDKLQEYDRDGFGSSGK